MLLKTAFVLSIIPALTVTAVKNGVRRGKGNRKRPARSTKPIYKCGIPGTGWHWGMSKPMGWHTQSTVLVAEGPHPHWGKWGEIHMCPENHYAVSGRVSDQPVQYDKDDTALNGYQMRCVEVGGFTKNDGKIIMKGAGTYRTQYGLRKNGAKWADPVTCPAGSFVFQHRVRMEPNLEEGDDTAINGMSMGCRYSVLNKGSGQNTRFYYSYQTWGMTTEHGMTTNSDDHYVLADVHKWGPMLGWVTCPHRSYMCGFQLKGEWEDYPEEEDDYVGMTGMRMICCRMPWDDKGDFWYSC